MAKNLVVLFGVVSVMILFLTVLVSAIDVKYSDSYLPKDKSISNGITGGDVLSIKQLSDDKDKKPKKDTVKSKYPKIEITTDKFLGLFGGDPIMDIELIDHTEFCTVDCYSILEVNLQQRSSIIDELETRSFVGNTLEYTNNIETKTYILKNISYIIEEDIFDISYENVPGTNGGMISKPNKISTTNTLGWKEEFVEYNGEELDPGKYYIKIIGKKNFNEVIDWVPTIKNEKIEALAWWNITEVYGNGSMGDVYFSTTTKTYGNMVLNVDYTVAGNTLFLMTNKVYNFNSFYLGPGTTLSTNNITGAAIYIMSKTDLNIQGLVNFTGRLQPGQYNTTSFSYLGDSFTTPSVANGASGYAGGSQAGGFGGSGYSGGVQFVDPGIGVTCPSGNGVSGNIGGYPFGTPGAGASVVNTNDACVQANGNPGTRSAGPGGGAMSYDSGSGCTIRGFGGAGGGSYGANGGSGSTSGTHTSTWSCYSGAGGGGGGGAGGSAGRPGLNLVMRGMNTTINNQIHVSGTNGQKGGNGGQYSFGYWDGGWVTSSTGDGGGGGGGGGGASSGNVKIYYRYLTNSSSLDSLIYKTAGTGGTGGTFYSGINSAGSGGSGSAGTLTTYQEGFVVTQLLNPLNGTQVVIPSIMTFTANITPTIATLVNATFYLYNNGTLNNTQVTTLSGTAPVTLQWNRTAAQIPDGSYSWAVQTCWTDGTVPKCEYTQNNSFTTFSVQFGASTYRNTTYEMLVENYQMNVTSTGFVNLSATLVWDNVEYNSTTGGNLVNATFSSNVNIPIGTGTKSFHWHVSYGGQLKESPSYNVTVLPALFSVCNATNNVQYLTLNYRDEISLAYINASTDLAVWNYNVTGNGNVYGKTYSYTNSTRVLTQSYCFTPSYVNLIIPSASYKYSASGYATKTWPFRDIPLTNASATYTLYLINLVDSGTSPVTFQITNIQTGTALTDARVRTIRDISGTPTTLNDGYTDASGTVSYYMSPIYPYTIQIDKTGCTSGTYTITPTSSLYTLTMTCGTTGAVSTSKLDGIVYVRGPRAGRIEPGTYDFTYIVKSSGIYNLTAAKFEIYDNGNLLFSNETLTGSPSCNSSECSLSYQYTLYAGDDFKGKYYIKTDNSTDWLLLEADARWITIYINRNASLSAISRFTENFNELIDTWGSYECNVHQSYSSCIADTQCKWVNATILSSEGVTGHDFCLMKDEYNKREFDRFVIIFFVMAVILFLVSKFTGYDFAHPGALALVLFALIAAGSYYGLFYMSGLTSSSFINQWIVFFSSLCVAFGIIMNTLRRSSY